MPQKERSASPLELLSAIEKIDGSGCMKCSDYALLFGEDSDDDAMAILSWATSMMLTPKNPNVPFVPFLRFGDQSSPNIDTFSLTSVFCLSAISGNIKDPELRARISDLIATRIPRLVTQAHIAVDAYFASAQRLTAAGEHMSAIRRVERALRLGYKYRKAPGERYSSIAESLVQHIEQTDKIQFPFDAIRLVYELRIKEDSWIYAQCLIIAESLAKKKRHRIAVSLLEVAVSCAISLNDKDKEQDVYRKIADCHIDEAKIHDSLLSSSCLMAAIEALEKIPQTREERDALYIEMRGHQKEWRHFMTTISIPSGDVTDVVKEAVELVQGVDFFDSLFRLILFVSQPAKVTSLKNQTREMMRDSIFAHLGAEHFDHEGIPVATTPAMTGNSENDEATWAHMMRMMQIAHTFEVKSRILPALESINNSFYWDSDFWKPILRNNPFVPPGHAEYFERGLNAGLHGDFVTSTHLLIPQIENSLRYVLKQKSKETSRKYPDGTQERDGLKYLLDHQDILDAFGENIITGLKSILIDKVYGDLRNQVSHGYAPSSHMHSDPAIFLWWQMLYITLRPYANFWKERYGANFSKKWGRPKEPAHPPEDS
ncbi:DUF4209 domain-containing protein [Pseudomonas sp. GZD-222]|uniref:DUF4209 domain-containing protein n=1 Tax=Pseudomonas sp. GZD-222 TaxID=3404805 RepID=UPI003BB6A5CA